jgi:hypothetical protein
VPPNKNQKLPPIENKRVWASIEKMPEEVIEEAFAEARNREERFILNPDLSLKNGSNIVFSIFRPLSLWDTRLTQNAPCNSANGRQRLFRSSPCPEVNRRTLQRDIKTMIEKELIASEGATNQLVYLLKA